MFPVVLSRMAPSVSSPSWSPFWAHLTLPVCLLVGTSNFSTSSRECHSSLYSKRRGLRKLKYWTDLQKHFVTSNFLIQQLLLIITFPVGGPWKSDQVTSQLKTPTMASNYSKYSLLQRPLISTCSLTSYFTSIPFSLCCNILDLPGSRIYSPVSEASVTWSVISAGRYLSYTHIPLLLIPRSV